MTEGYRCQTTEINVPNISPLNFTFKSPVMVLLFFFRQDCIPSLELQWELWISEKNKTKGKRGWIFYSSSENSLSNTDEWPASAFKNTVETFSKPNNFAITKYKMAKNYTYILTSATWSSTTVQLLKLPRCS